MNGVCSYRDPIFHLRAVFKFSILILSDPYQGYSTRQSVQTLDGLIPARVQQESKAHQASRAGRFAKTSENRQLHSLLHIKVLWLATRIKQAQFEETVFC